MKVNGGVWDGHTVELGDQHVGLVVMDRPRQLVWVYDKVDTPDGGQLDVRENDGRPMDHDKRFEAGGDPRWMVRVVDDAEVEEEVGL